MVETELPVILESVLDVATETTARVVDHLAQTLVDAGVQIAFGIPGGAISPLHDALFDRPEIRVVTNRHEAGAIFAAAGYSKLTRRASVVVVTSGPGLLNCITGIASAYAEGLPVVIIAGEAARGRFGRNALQDGSAHGLDVTTMLRSITKGAFQLHNPDSAASTLLQAIQLAESPHQGPVVLTLPTDVGATTCGKQRAWIPRTSIPACDDEAIAHAAEALRNAGRAVIVAGIGATTRAASAALIAFAEHCQLPVITTPSAKGAIPESHPLCLGVFGVGAHASAARYLSDGVDVTLVVGASLSEVETNGWSDLLRPRQHLIQVDNNPNQLNRSYRASLAITADSGDFLRRLRTQMGAVDTSTNFGVERALDASSAEDGPSGLIAPQRAIWEIQQLMPKETIYTLDIGEHTIFGVHHLEIEHADGFQLMMGLGSMASGIGAAMGARLASGRRPVVALCGDGGFAMAISDLATLAEEKIPVVIAVLNDRRYGMVEIGHEAIFGRKVSYPTSLADIGAVCKGMGVASVLVEHTGELLALSEVIRATNGPLVIDIRIDPLVRMPNNSRIKYLAKTTATSARLQTN